MHFLHISLMCSIILSSLKSGFLTSTKERLTFYVHRSSWNDAKKVCEENGGSLLKITSSTKQMFLESYLAEEWKSNSSGNIWVGLHEIDPLDGSKVQWLGCEDVAYTNFAAGFPDLKTDVNMCFSVDLASGQWSTERCDQKLSFICEENIGECDFDRVYLGKGCNEPLVQSAELSLTDCLNSCRDIPIQTGGTECWGVGFFLGYAGEDCRMFLSVDPEACLKNNFVHSSINMYLKTCFTQNINRTVIPAVSSSLTPDSSCIISYSSQKTELTSALSEASNPPTSTTAMYSTSGQYSGGCFCACGTNSSLSLDELLAQIKLDLSVDKKETSAYQRSKTCAGDNRRSAVAIGVGGIVFLVLEIGFFLLLDLSRLINFITSIHKRGCSRCKLR